MAFFECADPCAALNWIVADFDDVVLRVRGCLICRTTVGLLVMPANASRLDHI